MKGEISILGYVFRIGDEIKIVFSVREDTKLHHEFAVVGGEVSYSVSGDTQVPSGTVGVTGKLLGCTKECLCLRTGQREIYDRFIPFSKVLYLEKRQR